MPYLDRRNRVCGFLDIEEKESSDRFCRRYFVLDAPSNFLFWYMDNPQNLPKGAEFVGSLRLTYVSKVSEATAKQKPKAEFCFVINALSRRYFLQANDAVDLKDWVLALNKATKITVPKATTVAENSEMAPVSSKPPSSSLQAYKTEIVGGVVVQTPITQNDAEGIICVRLEGECSLRPSSRPNAVRCGYCVKQGNVRKSWKRRFFTLDDQAVSYFKNESDKVPLRSIRLREIQKVHECLVKSGDLLMRDNLFEIITSARTFYIQTDTPEDMQGWIRDIREKIQDFRGPHRDPIFGGRSSSLYGHSNRSHPALPAGRSKPSLVKSTSVTSSWQPWTPVPSREGLAEQEGTETERGIEKDSAFSSLPSLNVPTSDPVPRQRHRSQPQPSASDSDFDLNRSLRTSDV
ncbi:pleckstrin homology domain-containing family A member 2-like isoform X1 [Denticeps clupeoides]|uniref:pleckstrin homology domain-containing family A member 2-like isoform X1 n=2 Tax=Denticeps clupeoides TaxID=299321 RepID=UPI0010A2BA5F|nr:pleckstrin homology domain-containing family A member 2-like isoform X1 [Denticeps clupeoides]XP_028820899.1 pleckstrin homology domain-containing family A member 2-like isoform X1 [Denticeps clupeoides]XP_028820900.1 pleckstrin homology domain-containing family A member 2-like isoform X1 [Denticeps clupeoides]XP_028851929.1 pleckstrin homology domain-containing family A member 2-like isoform X1 [Denticeps clupeoides]XP_028851930.1 pleckstrin homology domain-containing family A member 2-like